MNTFSFQENREMNHIRFYFNQIDKYKKAMNNEQMGRLFFAIASYAMTGVRPEVDGDILYPFDEAAYKIDRLKQQQ